MKPQYNPSTPKPAPALPPEQLNSLLQMAGKQLGKNPQQLKSQLESGQVGQALNGLDPKKAAQINAILNNPAQIQQILNNPQVQNLINSLTKK